ncbi:MAG TPA: TolC family protein [Bryobacteraceae bacterium]|jgi:cobalt-zinc-cadmium efflux system outer membrane protein
MSKAPFFRAALALALLPSGIFAQSQSLTWQQIKDRFEASNPTLQAAKMGIDEARAQEVTAFLRPNPTLTLSTDGTQITPYQGVYRPFAGTQVSPNISYLYERQHKRDLRHDAAVQNTAVTQSTYEDQRRTLLFTLRNAFVQLLQAKAVLQNAKDNLAFWDRELEINRKRYNAGDLAMIDLNRLELQRVQFESDLETATVNLRTSKIQVLQLMNDRTPIEQFDVSSPYDYVDQLMPLDELHEAALAARPDLKAAMQSIDLAKINHQLAIANGSADPTFSAWWTHNPSFNNPYDFNTIGLSVSVPLRIFDKNQGEKERTQIDIGRSERLRDANRALVFSDVDSAYWTLVEALNMLKPYKSKYLPLAEDNRNRITIAFKNGGSSLLDLLDAEKAYRDTRLAYLNLIGAYMTAAAQLNLAAGREVIQ